MQIYVACLAAYNNGILHGRWIDCTEATVEDIQTEVNTMLKASPMSDAEEWAIHDYECPVSIPEYASWASVVAIAEGLREHPVAFAWLYQDQSYSASEALEKAPDCRVWEYEGFSNDDAVILGAYAEALEEETGGLDDVPERFRNHIDWRSIGQEMECNGGLSIFEFRGKTYVLSE